MKNNSTHIPEIAQKKVLDEPLCEISEIAENGTDKVLCKSEKNSSVHMKYVNFSSAQKRALDATLYAISAGRAFFRRMLQMRRNFLTPCTLIRTQGKKLQSDMALCGRSMVEMLGVLAIIGVLSIGAIAGYSKAMMKHKLNKQTEQINTIFNNIETYTDMWLNMTNPGYYQIPLLQKLKAIPEEMIKEGDKNNAYDIFNNRLQIVYHFPNDSVKSSYFEMAYFLTGAASPKDVCLNLIHIAKGRSYYLDNAVICKQGGACKSSLKGDLNCKKGGICLKDITVSQMNEYCDIDTSGADEKNYYMALVFGLR